MDDWVELFKQSPIGATLGVVIAAILWWWKNRQEKDIDNREVTRLTEALIEERKARQEAEDRADTAIAKQIELVERYSEMRAQNERMLERMGQLTEKIDRLTRENADLAQEVHGLKEQLASFRRISEVG